MQWLSRNRRILGSLISILILVLALVALRSSLAELEPRSIGEALYSVPAGSWVAALAAVALSYACLVVYDVTALKTLGLNLPLRTAATAATLGNAVSNMLGLSFISGGAVRMRVYHIAGLSTPDVIRIVALTSLTFWGGIFVCFALSLPLLSVGGGAIGAWLPDPVQLALPWLVGFLLVAGLAYLGRGGRKVKIAGIVLPLPGAPTAIGQILAAFVDLAACAAIIFVLLPNGSLWFYPTVLTAYVVAVAFGVLTHLPGGVGVFEAIMCLLLPEVDKGILVAALIGYRLVYYLLPFMLAVVVSVIAERRTLLKKARALAHRTGSLASAMAAPGLSAMTFLAGATLVWASALPSAPEDTMPLSSYLPHAADALSHLASSAIGTMLMFVGWGLYRRLDAAWLACLMLAVAGFVLALLRGPDLVQAGICIGLVGALGANRAAFYRQTSLMAEPFSRQWLVAVAAVVTGAVCIGLWAFKDVPYANDLWWRIDPSGKLSGDASRFLRAALLSGLLTAVIAVRWLLSPVKLKVETKLPGSVFAVALAHSTSSQAHLARTGDKAFLVAPEGDAFLMFRQSRHTLVAMGDPVGPRERWSALVWRLRDLADQQRARLAFYECSPAMLELAVDLGLGAIKLGEEARVPLASFTLDGKEHAKLRQAVNRALREGLRFRVAQREEVPALLPVLRAISDDWLARKGGREKQFSLGRFESQYLCEEPVALVEKDGKVVAFANLWPMPSRQELSFDLMRYSTGAPAGTMDFMFTQMMLWGREEGYQWLSLGVAPLSGIEGRRLAPAWARIANQMFRHGERFYGFEGLRRYKNKFAPVWIPRYLAAPRGLGTALALFDILMLVSAPSPPRQIRSGHKGYEPRHCPQGEGLAA